MAYEEMTIKTNNARRPVLSWFELSENEQAEFDYLLEDNRYEMAQFISYKGVIYDLGEFCTTKTLPEFNPLYKWDGYHSDSFYSGVVVRYTDDHEYVILGTFFS